mmetsp:Transcript_10126/g.22998  ORF Transcript_10126/g.22998 Transcript_10126/m.22998 type:complete len:1047 (+) Transcript_10126:67-3207(+)
MTVRVLCPGERRLSVVKPAAPAMYGPVQSVHTVVKAAVGVPNIIASLPTPAKAHHRVVSTGTARGQVILKPSHALLGQAATTQVVRHKQEAVAPVPQDPRFGSEGPTPLPTAWRDRLEVCSDVPVLGGGAFAEVFQVRDIETQQRFAVKVMHRPNFALRGIEKQISNEIAAMDRAVSIAHECGVEAHVVHLLDVTEEGNFVFLLMELCEGGDLLRRLYADPLGRFAESSTCVWAQQLLLGLRNIHATGILHRDIKPDNLLCNEEGMLKIADFGWCTELAEEPNNLAGTFVYMSPEVLASELQTEKVDVWSTGITLYQMLVGKPLLNTYLGPGATNLTATNPHEATNIKLRWLLEEIQTTCPPSLEQKPADLSMTCWDFLRCLLVPEVDARATVEQALAHPWLAHLAPVPNPHVMAFNTASVIDTVMEDSDHENDLQQEDLAARSPNTPKPAHQKQDGGMHSPAAAHVCDTSIESLTNVPTPSKERTWDPSRNIAYSPPVKQNALDQSELELEPAPSAPSEQLPSPKVLAPPTSSEDSVNELNMTQTELSQSQSKFMDEGNVDTECSPSPRAVPLAKGRLSEPLVRAPPGIETPPVHGGKLERSRRYTSTGCTGESPNTFESFPMQQQMRKQKQEASLLLDQVQGCEQQIQTIKRALNTLKSATLGSVAMQDAEYVVGATMRASSPMDKAPGVPPIASWAESSPSPRRRVCAVSSMARPCRTSRMAGADSLLATAPAFPGAATRVPTVTPARAVRRPVRASQHHERTAVPAQHSSRGEGHNPNLASSATAPVWCGANGRQWQQHPPQATVRRSGSQQPSAPMSDRKRSSLRKEVSPPPPSPSERQSCMQVSRSSAKSRTPIVPKAAWVTPASGTEARGSPSKEVLSKTVTPQCMAQYHVAPTCSRTGNLGVISRGSAKGVSSTTLNGGSTVVAAVAPEGCSAQPPPRTASAGSASLAVGGAIAAAAPVATQGGSSNGRSTIQPVRLAGKQPQQQPQQQTQAWARSGASPAPVQYTRCAGCESVRRSSMPCGWVRGRAAGQSPPAVGM